MAGERDNGVMPITLLPAEVPVLVEWWESRIQRAMNTLQPSPENQRRVAGAQQRLAALVAEAFPAGEAPGVVVPQTRGLVIPGS